MVAMSAMPSGVSLSLIRDPQAEHSYFVFGIRNGGNVYVLTDKSDWAHPMQKHMTRRPDRHFEKRAFQYHFPYQLMEYEADEKHIHIPKQEGLVRYNQQAIVLGKMISLEPQQIVWLIMVLALIYENYWKNKKQLPAMSYTGEMIKIPEALTGKVPHLPAKLDAPLQFQQLTVEDIKSDRLEAEGQWGQSPTKANSWLEQRHGQSVPQDYLNVIQREDLPMLPDSWERGGDLNRRESRIKGLEPVEFGTEEQLRRDVKWFARYNQALWTSSKATQEFDKKKDEVLDWYERHVRSNVDVLLKATANMEFNAFKQTNTEEDGPFDRSHVQPSNILRVAYNYKTYPWSMWLSRPWKAIALSSDSGRGHPKCYLRGSHVSVWARFRPSTPECLAKLAGVGVNRLPVFLRHWYREVPYYGNSILDRIDPMEWVVRNPWRSLDLNIHVLLSKQGFNQIRRQHKLPAFSKNDWDSIKVD